MLWNIFLVPLLMSSCPCYPNFLSISVYTGCTQRACAWVTFCYCWCIIIQPATRVFHLSILGRIKVDPVSWIKVLMVVWLTVFMWHRRVLEFFILTLGRVIFMCTRVWNTSTRRGEVNWRLFGWRRGAGYYMWRCRSANTDFSRLWLNVSCVNFYCVCTTRWWVLVWIFTMAHFFCHLLAGSK